MTNRDGRTVTISSVTVIKTLAILAVLWFFVYIRDIVAMVFVAFVIASAIRPWVDTLQKRKIPRVASVALFAAVILGVISLMIVLIVPPLVDQIRQLTTHLPSVYESLSRFFVNQTSADSAQAIAGIEKNLQALSQGLVQITSGFFGALSTVFGGFAAFLTVLVISFYMAVEENGTRKVLHSLAPDKYKPYLSRLVGRIEERMGSWLRGQLLLSAIDGSITFVGLTLIGVRYALILALLTAFMRIIPYIGPVVAAVPAVLIAASSSLMLGVGVIIFFVVYNQIVDNFVVPKVMQQTIGLHPVIILVLILIGARLGGIMGTILSLPIGAIVAIFIQDFFTERRMRENALSTEGS